MDGTKIGQIHLRRRRSTIPVLRFVVFPGGDFTDLQCAPQNCQKRGEKKWKQFEPLFVWHQPRKTSGPHVPFFIREKLRLSECAIGPFRCRGLPFPTLLPRVHFPSHILYTIMVVAAAVDGIIHFRIYKGRRGRSGIPFSKNPVRVCGQRPEMDRRRWTNIFSSGVATFRKP